MSRFTILARCISGRALYVVCVCGCPCGISFSSSAQRYFFPLRGSGDALFTVAGCFAGCRVDKLSRTSNGPFGDAESFFPGVELRPAGEATFGDAFFAESFLAELPGDDFVEFRCAGGFAGVGVAATDVFLCVTALPALPRAGVDLLVCAAARWPRGVPFAASTEARPFCSGDRASISTKLPLLRVGAVCFFTLSGDSFLAERAGGCETDRLDVERWRLL